jgi:hypothetical protein
VRHAPDQGGPPPGRLLRPGDRERESERRSRPHGVASGGAQAGDRRTFGNGPWSAERNYQNFAALMDGFVVYDRPLTDKEIAALGNRGF